MKRTLVRYRAKPDRAQENERLIEKVFQELQVKSPQDVRYLVLKLGHGTFVHFAVAETEDGINPLTKMDAFRSFQNEVKERCIEPPQVGDATIVGSYRMLER